MKREVFEAFVSDRKNMETIDKICYYAARLHDVDVNQKYDNKPYSFHLEMVAHYVMKWGDKVCYEERHIIPLIFGAYFHDSIEDARLTYNDVMKIAKKYMDDNQALMATEIVYALTDEKGRTRAERGSDKHYEDIRNTLYAPFIKFCDRYANTKYSVEMESRMAEKYRAEMMDFVLKIGNDKFIPNELIQKILKL